MRNRPTLAALRARATRRIGHQGVRRWSRRPDGPRRARRRGRRVERVSLRVGCRLLEACRDLVQIVELERRDVERVIDAGGRDIAAVGAEGRLRHSVVMNGDRLDQLAGRDVENVDASVRTPDPELRSVYAVGDRIAHETLADGHGGRWRRLGDVEAGRWPNVNRISGEGA